MNEWLITFLSLSVAGTLLILVLFLLKPIYKNRLSHRWQYYIWLIVIARLLIPFAPETNLVSNLFSNISTNMIEPIANAYYGTNEPIAQDENISGNQTAFKEKPITDVSPIDNETTENQTIGVIWLVVALILLIRKITIYQSFTKYIRAGRTAVDDIEKLEQLGEIINNQNIKVSVELYTNSLISSPLLIGFWKPCIVLPTTDFSMSDFRFTILHELTHYKRMDMFYKWLIQIVICLHWFNPFVYLIGKEINRACELSCDEAVISNLDPKERRGYGDTLLNAIKTGGTYKNSVAFVTLWESKAILSERLGAIMTYKKQTKAVVLVSISLALLLLCGATYAGACSAKQPTPNLTAPDNIPTITATADTITQIEKPNVDITIENNASVKFVSTTDNEISVDYGSTLYDVDVSNESGNWKMNISYIGNYSKYPAATVYIPNITYGVVTIKSTLATLKFNNVFQHTNTINADMAISCIFYTIPEGFTGNLNATTADGYLELSSNDKYKDCDITIANCASYGEISTYFTKTENAVTYSNGTRTGIVNFDFKDGGYAIIK